MRFRCIIAVIAAVAFVSMPMLASAGPKGRSGFKPPRSSAIPGDQGKTGTIKDLGINPSTKAPSDMVKSKPPESAAGAVPGAGMAPQAPTSAFSGGGGFGGSWMSWAFLGYLFGRHQHPSKPAEKELELIPDPPGSI
ncbi:hypothetical protein [Desulfomonile tiedjei]|nr:hypothetical protein [Desulfomonile tiedjei]